jgi:hypothetical protein
MVLLQFLEIIEVFGDYPWVEYLCHAFIMPSTKRNGIRCVARARQELHSAFEHNGSRDGTYSLAVEGAITVVVFEAYVERVLAPGSRKGQVVIMDNLGAQTQVGKGTGRGEGLRVGLPAVLLTGSQPARRSVR